MSECDVPSQLLTSCKVYDNLAYISSVIKDVNGRTVLKIRGSDNSNSLNMLRAVRSVMPLAKANTVINSLDESMETQVIIPNNSDELHRAIEIAHNTIGSKLLKVISTSLFVFSFLLITNSIMNASKD